MEKGELIHCWWECKSVQPLWRTVWRFLKNRFNHMTWQSHSKAKENKISISKRFLHSHVYCNIIYSSQDMELIKVQLMDKENVVYKPIGFFP
jgi:hypothetical protein